MIVERFAREVLLAISLFDVRPKQLNWIELAVELRQK
jgi:hypothetical protein